MPLTNMLPFLSCFLCADVCLLNKKPGTIPRSDIATKYEKKIFLRRIPHNRFLAKPLRVIKHVMKEFLKNLSFGVDVKLYVPPKKYKFNSHNMSSVRSQAVMLTEGLQWSITYV